MPTDYRLLRALTVIFSLMGASSVLANTAVAPASLLLTPERVLDVKRGRYHPPGTTVLVRGGKIIAVGTGLKLPADARRVALPGVTLLPGLIDAHTHLLHEVNPRDRGEHAAMVIETTSMTDTERALRGARFAHEMLDAGFTTVRDLGNAGRYGDVALRNAIARGDIEGPQMVVSGPALAGEGGQFGPKQAPWRHLVGHEYRIVRGVTDAQNATREALARGVDGIKIIVGSETAVTLSAAEVRAIVQEAHRKKRWVAAHCTDDDAVRIALAAGADSIEHGYDLSDATLRAMKKANVALVPTDFPTSAYSSVITLNPYVPTGDQDRYLSAIRAQRKSSLNRLARARRMGVKIVAGSDAYYAQDDMTRGEIAASIFSAYAESGMSGLDIVRSATIDAATLLRQQEHTGALAAGLDADIIGVRGDVLKSAAALQHIEFVMNDGRTIRAPAATAPTR